MWGKQHAPKRTWYPLFHPELVSNILKRRCAYPNGFRWPELKKKRREKQRPPPWAGEIQAAERQMGVHQFKREVPSALGCWGSQQTSRCDAAVGTMTPQKYPNRPLWGCRISLKFRSLRQHVETLCLQSEGAVLPRAARAAHTGALLFRSLGSPAAPPPPRTPFRQAAPRRLPDSPAEATRHDTTAPVPPAAPQPVPWPGPTAHALQRRGARPMGAAEFGHAQWWGWSVTVRELGVLERLRASRDPEALRRRPVAVAVGSCTLTAPRPCRSHCRHVSRLQRRLRPPHHHLFARGPPLPSRWVPSPGDVAVELPRHGPGLPAEPGCSRRGELRRLGPLPRRRGEAWCFPWPGRGGSVLTVPGTAARRGELGQPRSGRAWKLRGRPRWRWGGV